MADTPKGLFRGAASTTSASLYTVPAATITVVTSIAVSNTAATAATFTLTLNGVAIHSATALAANSTAYIDLKQVLTAGQILAGFASATTVNFHISGVEVN